MPEPHFLGVGAHLSGTLWWRTLLADHPRIDLRRSQEDTAPFWDAFCERPATDADIAAYRERFAGAPDGALVGEWSDRYLYNAWMLPLLRRAAPNAKLLVLTRDPVDRYRSVLRYRLGERGDEAETTIHMTEAFHRGRYASQLRVLERFFAPDQVLVQQYERCLIDPLGEYRRVLRFLGLEDHVPQAIRRRPRRPDEVRFAALRRLAGRRVPAPAELWPDLEAALTTSLRDEMAAIADRVDLRLWPAFADLAPADAPAPRPPAPLPPPGARDLLRRLVFR